MIVNRKDFLSAVEAVLPGVSQSSIIAGADRVTIDKNTIYSSADIISVAKKFKFPEPLSLCIRAEELIASLRKFDAEEIDLRVNDTTLVIKAGRAKMSLGTHPVAKNSVLFIETPVWIPLSADFYDVLSACYIPNNKTTHAGVFVEGKVMASTDNHRINYAQLSQDYARFWINDNCVKTLIKYGNVFDRMAVTPAHVWFTSNDLMVAVKRLNDERYQIAGIQEYYKMCSLENVEPWDIPAGLADAVRRAAPFVALEDKAYPIKLCFSAEGIEVSVKQGSDSFEEMVEANLGIGVVYISVDYTQLLYGLKKSTRMGITFFKRGLYEYTMLVLYGERSTLMLTAMRVE